MPGRKELDQRKLVAKEAALLLYYRLSTEYKQAKEMASKSLGVRFLPSNREVAEELDALASLLEGEERTKTLVKMREDALEIMRLLSKFKPKLIGSVWRGTARKGSDIDIVVFSSDYKEVTDLLRKKGLKVTQISIKKKTEGDSAKEYPHIYLESPRGYTVDLVVKKPEEESVNEICDIYGDIIRGLTLEELEEVLKKDPTRRFLPP